MQKITNISTGQLVCDLAEGDTLRLNTRESLLVKDTDITEHIRHLSEIGKILIEKAKEPRKKNK